jgi:hypothetical protein
MASGLYRDCAIRPSLRDDTGPAKNDLFSLYEKMEEILKNEDEVRASTRRLSLSGPFARSPGLGECVRTDAYQRTRALRSFGTFQRF